MSFVKVYFTKKHGEENENSQKPTTQSWQGQWLVSVWKGFPFLFWVLDGVFSRVCLGARKLTKVSPQPKLVGFPTLAPSPS